MARTPTLAFANTSGSQAAPGGERAEKSDDGESFTLNLLFQAYGTAILKPVYKKTPHHRTCCGVILEATKGVPSAQRSQTL